ncbi:MAG: molybdopterin-dependent oxidoreductase, partial [Planctomycetota bacterium]
MSPEAAVATRTLTLTIDGKSVTVDEGTSIWDAAQAMGIDIPVLCHDPRLEPVGVCRLCVVDVEGARVNPASCVRACEDGMVVETNSETIEKRRAVLVEMLLSDHPVPCAREQQSGDCALEELGRRYGVLESPRWHRPEPAEIEARRKDPSSAVIAVDHEACILCDKCIRGCDDIQSNEVIGRNGKGVFARIGFDTDVPMGESTCVSCGECAAVCPTGALISRPVSTSDSTMGDLKKVDSVCPYCGVGCALTYYTDGKTVVKAEGRDSPVNKGRLCVKGRYGFDYSLHPQRLTKPLIRVDSAYPKGPLSGELRRAMAVAEGEGGNGKRRRGMRVQYDEILPGFREATWDEALDLVASKLGALKDEHGPNVLAGFGSAKCSNEEAYLFQKLIVCDPRRPTTADFAEHYVRFRPGTDVAFLNAMLHVIVEEGMVDDEFIRDRTNNFDAVKEMVAKYTPEFAESITGVPAEQIRAVARTYGNAKAAIMFWGMGISQHTTGTDNARCLIALCLATGNIGRPGTGLHPLRGQNNVQGASDAGLIPMVYPDYQKVADPAIQSRFEEAWGISLDPEPGLTVVEIMHGALDGTVKGMYMMGENPGMSDPNINKVRRALAALDFLVVQDIFLTETCEFADVILPFF